MQYPADASALDATTIATPDRSLARLFPLRLRRRHNGFVVRIDPAGRAAIFREDSDVSHGDGQNDTVELLAFNLSIWESKVFSNP